MFKLNKDILYLIFEELQDYKKVLFSCLTVDKTWCEIIIPILWRNPWNRNECLKGRKLLSNVIISHLSDESRNNLKSQGITFLTNPYQKPLFNYISFCRHLDLSKLNIIIDSTSISDIEGSAFSIVRKEIFNLFINENMRLTHLYIPHQFDYQIHLISGAKYCFSELEFLRCNTSINDDVLFGLTEICKSIKELELIIGSNNNHGIVKLIKATKRLFSIRFLLFGYPKNDESFCKILEDSLIKHANSIRCLKITKPVTNIISSFVNLNRLELNALDLKNVTTWNCLENLSLPFLQVLKARCIPIKVLASLIINTSGYLTEIKIDYIYHDEISNKNIIQAIYQNCPNLKYLKLLIRNNNILVLENLLVSCQYLIRLYIIIDNGNYFGSDVCNWDYLFEVLTKSSPISLFNFKFCFHKAPLLKSLNLFLDNWKNRHSMSLKTIHDSFWDQDRYWNNEHLNLIEKYKTQGIIRKYNHVDLFIDF